MFFKLNRRICFFAAHEFLCCKLYTMKPTLLILSAFTLLLLSCKKDQQPAPAEIPVQKTVEYHVFAAKDYSAPVYQNVKADVRLQVQIINYKTGEQTLVWDSVFSTHKVTDFPMYDNKTVIRKTYPVLDSHQKLNGSYSVRYDDNGYIKQEAFSDEAVPGKTFILIEADL